MFSEDSDIQVKGTYKEHIMYLILCFSYPLPKMFLLETLYGKNENNREIVNILLQLAVAVSLGLGWLKTLNGYDDKSNDSAASSKDIIVDHEGKSIHYNASVAAFSPWRTTMIAYCTP